MNRLIAILALAAVAGCSGTIGGALGPVLDPMAFVEAAGVTAECADAETIEIAPRFVVDWGGEGTTYGGGLFLGCDDKLFGLLCEQVEPEDGGKAHVQCEELTFWQLVTSQ